MDEEILTAIKTRLQITGTYHDDMITAYADDVKTYMVGGGVPESIVYTKGLGCLAKGIFDLMNLGSFSEIFKMFVNQLAFTKEEVIENDSSESEF